MENSSFVQVMKDWRRMCKAYTTDNDSCCEGCPVVDFHKHGCGAIFEMEDSTDWKRYADTIKAWAAEHPEPVYPTWFEWFKTVVPDEEMLQRGTYWDMQIPTDIASKLGIQPKEAKE